jgi:predicted nucleotidyltransferase
MHIIHQEMPTLRQRFGVEQLALFGSFARDEASENSDIDLVVSLAKPLGFAFVQLADYLEEKLGRKVDLITTTTVSSQ